MGEPAGRAQAMSPEPHRANPAFGTIRNQKGNPVYSGFLFFVSSPRNCHLGQFGAFLFGDDDPVEFVHLNPDVGIRHVHMDHRRLDVFMPHRFLNGASPEWLGKSAGYSDNRCPASDRTAEESSGGIGCRVPATPPKVAGVLPDQAANFHRNGWPGWNGIRIVDL